MKLNWSNLFSYGLPAMPLAVLLLPATVFLPEFYAVDLGLGLATVGSVLLLARLCDVLSDPVVGLLSDRYLLFGKHRAGWILAGAFITALFTWLTFVPIEALISPFYLFIVTVGLYIGWTVVQIPLYALGAELSSDYNERTTIMSARDGMMLVGMVIALLLFALGLPDEKTLHYLAIFIIIVLPIASYHLFRQSYISTETSKNNTTLLQGLTALKENRPFRRTVSAYLVNGFANAIPATVFIIFVEQGLGRPDLKGPLLFGYFMAGLICLPLWVKLSHKFGKARTWRWAMIFAVVVFSAVAFVTPETIMLFAVIAVLSGAALGADLALPSSIQTDVIDLDRVQTGQERAGLYFALWGVATKLSLALAVGLAFPLLALFGCQTDSCTSFTGLKWIYAGLPVLIKLVAVTIMWHDPIPKEMHEELQQKLKVE